MATPLMRRLGWAAAILLALLLAFALAGYLLVPRYLAATAREFVEQRLQKQLALGTIEMAPFDLALEVSDIAIRERDGQELVGAGRISLDLSAASIWRRALVIERLAVDAPRIAAVLDAERRLNLMGLVPPSAAAETDAAGPLPRIELREFAVSRGRASIEDRGRTPALRAELQPIEFTLRDFTTASDPAEADSNRFQLTAQARSGERLAWQGRFELQPFAARGALRLERLGAATVRSHVGDALPFVLQEGLLRLAARYELTTAGADGLALRATIDALDAANLALAEKPAPPGNPASPVNPTPPAIRVAGLAIRGATVDLGARHIDLGRVAVQGARVDVVRDAAGINLERLFRDDTPDEPSTWTVALPRLAVVDGELEFADRTRTPAAVVPARAIRVIASGFDARARSDVAVSLDAELAQGRLSATSTVTVVPDEAPTLRARLAMQGFDLLTLLPYVADRVRLDVRSASLDVEGDVALDAARALRFDGRAGVRDLHTLDRAVRRDLVKWRRLGIEGIRLRTDAAGRGTLRIERVDADSPYVDLVIGPDGRTNIADVLAREGDAPAAPQPGEAAATPATATPATAAPATAAPARPSPLAVSIGRVSIRGGSANFADLSITPNFGTGIQTLAGSVTGLSSAPDSRARVDLKGEVDRYAPVEIAGEVNYLAARSYTDLRVNFRNMELTTLNPYSGKFAGYRIERGKLSADFSYRIADRKLDAKHHIVLTQLQLGDRVESKDAVGLPLKLAIALLKDRDGNIELDLPVSGSLDDPQFRIGPIVWKMFVNLIGKIVTAPFALIGSLFGGGDEARFVDFAPGTAVLTPAMLERLAGVRQALVARPGLRLELPLATDRALDGEALREIAWRQTRLALAPEAVRADPARYLKALTARATADGIDLQSLGEPSVESLEQALRARIEVGDAQFEALARSRAAAVQDVLLQSGEVDPVRVFITRPVPAVAKGSVVQLELALSAD